MYKVFIKGCITLIIILTCLNLFEGWIFSLLWNWLIPLFWISAPVINIWQALGIMVFLNIIGSLLFSKKIIKNYG